MQEAEHHSTPGSISVQNIGGIPQTDVELSAGVTLLTGENATNRTSFLQAIIAAMGGQQATLKADADEGHVTLTIDDQEYSRTLTKTETGVRFQGNPYLEDATAADLFAFLLHDNAARQAVIQAEDLREVIMKPVDTVEIKQEISQLQDQRDELDTRIAEIQEAKKRLPELETEKTRLQTTIQEKESELEDLRATIDNRTANVDQTEAEKQRLEETRDELQEARRDLKETRQELKTQRESLDAVKAERKDVKEELRTLPETSDERLAQLERELEQLRDEETQAKNVLGTLQDLVSFNETMLEGRPPEFLAASTDTQRATSSDPTEKLLSDDSAEEVTCWTCGSTVSTDGVQDMLDQLREERKEHVEEVSQIGDEKDEVKKQIREIEEKQERKESLEDEIDRLEDEIETRESQIERLKEDRVELEETVDELSQEVESLQDSTDSGLLDLHSEVTDIEVEIRTLTNKFESVREQIAAIEEEAETLSELEDQRKQVKEELTDARTRIDDIEDTAITEFNERMETVLELLEYENLDRVWIKKKSQSGRRGRSDSSTFELNIVRSTDSGTVYGDTISNLSESEREVTGLVFALAGYLVHDLHEQCPFILLDSLEAIDADRIANLVEYYADFPRYLVVALLPADAQALPDDYHRVRDI